MKKRQKGSDWLLPGKIDVGFLVLVLVLLTIGLLMLFSASYAYCYAQFNNSYHFILRQALFAVIGVVAAIAGAIAYILNFGKRVDRISE